jgi:hypothetical protein
MEDRVEQLRRAIENLINVKLHDALVHPHGLSRLIAHRGSGVASASIRQAENELEDAIAAAISTSRAETPYLSVH